MASVIDLPINWQITRIPYYKSQADSNTLRQKCERLFRIKGDRHMVVVLKSGEIVKFASVEQVIEAYRRQKVIHMISFTESPIELLTHVQHE